jgi:hypothetical protein
VLLTIGNKYDMPALLSKAATFLSSKKATLNGNQDSLQFGWKWITLADKAGLLDVAHACIDASTALDALVAACKKELLAGMSPATCSHLAEAVARQSIAQQQENPNP